MVYNAARSVFYIYIRVNAVSEFVGMDPEKVISLIERNPKVSIVPAASGKMNKPKEAKNKGIGKIAPVIDGSCIETGIGYEGRITYDVRFFVCDPGKEKRSKVIVDMEAQKKCAPDYNLVTYKKSLYASRMISARLALSTMILKK